MYYVGQHVLCVLLETKSLPLPPSLYFLFSFYLSIFLCSSLFSLLFFIFSCLLFFFLPSLTLPLPSFLFPLSPFSLNLLSSHKFLPFILEDCSSTFGASFLLWVQCFISIEGSPKFPMDVSYDASSVAMRTDGGFSLNLFCFCCCFREGEEKKEDGEAFYFQEAGK